MSVLVLLIAVSLIVALGFLIAFLWAVKNGQFSDTYTPSVRILFDDDSADKIKEEKKGENKTDDSKKHGLK